MTRARTLYDKLWESHVVRERADGSTLLYVDRHLLQEVSTPQSFRRLEAKNLKPRRPLTNLAVPDHAVPTDDRTGEIRDPMARAQVERLAANCAAMGIPFIPLDDGRQGIVHVIGPELGFTLPGITLACGDSHTSTHGAFGTLAFGIGASECATVMATNTLPQRRARNMEVWLDGTLPEGVSAKDVTLALIGRIGCDGAAGHALEYRGPGVEALSMEARMTLCNMAIEAGTRTGLVAPDDVTFAYLAGRPHAPRAEHFERAVAYWKTLPTDEGAVFDRSVRIDLSTLVPQVTWGTSPDLVIDIDGHVPDPDREADPQRRERIRASLAYMGLTPGMKATDIAIDRVFIGSCTNGRMEDLEAAARVIRGRKVAPDVRAMVVPGSTAVKREAEARGLDRVFIDAGFEWRESGCSMCVAMNADRLAPGERCASTSNRNFEGRQGRGGRTHLMSPAMA
ncbi:MAG TPA: 3-isopropylmalate dehydratase large subunit, partial [Sphingomonadales bacterium]